MDEPNVLTRWAIYFFASGSSAIWGAVAVATALTLSLHPRTKTFVPPIFKLSIGVIGIAFIACGSPPVPKWFQRASILWLVCAFSATRWSSAESSVASPGRVGAVTKSFWRLSPVIWLVICLLFELPWHASPRVTSPSHQVLVIGDSVTAGLNDTDITWPRLLATDSDIDVVDASQPGATLESAQKQNQLLSNRPGTLILEIGGNDLLEGLPVVEFDRRLGELLKDVVQSDRHVLMFELPLPPLSAGYGAAQRRLSQRYGITLIPKRVFASVLTTRGATVDGIHLSSTGQVRMKALVQSLVDISPSSRSGEYQRLERGTRVAP